MKSASERTFPASVNSSADASMSIPLAACQLTSTVSSAVGTGALAPLGSSVDMRQTLVGVAESRAYTRAAATVVSARGGRRSHTGGTCAAAAARQRRAGAARMRRNFGRVHLVPQCFIEEVGELR